MRELRYTVGEAMMTGDDVRRVQIALGTVKPDGWYGPDTELAVKFFQCEQGLVGDGVVDEATRKALLDVAYPLIRARNFTAAQRQPGDVRYITIHTIQCPPGPQYAESNAQWFAGPRAPKASVHWWVDTDSIVQGLEERHLAWGAKSGPLRPAQLYSVHVEHAGWTANPARGIEATDWLSGEGRKVLDRSTKLCAEICNRWDIEPRRVSTDELRDDLLGSTGFVGHVDWTRAFNVPGGHVDPGDAWPWGIFLDLVRAEL